MFARLTNRVCNIAVALVLLRNEGQIEHDPAKHSGSQFHEALDIDLTQVRQMNAWVELSANEPVVDDIARHSSSCKLTLLLVVRLDFERLDVNVDREYIGNDDVASQELDVVAVDESPDGKVGALHPSTSGASDEDRGIRKER